ncbi:MAG TPA: lysophospholipid acyltransferase family protein [Kofleriaceae bacterium]|jgi:1-acyl-sn-glycerol-3-phosphate acyltransferase|nr:lysophospholipid acyltransferase family protein [Kofleriaceae bacterium]
MVSTTFRRIVQEAPFFDEGHGFDVFGLHPRSLVSAVVAARPLYESYFRVDSAGSEAIPREGPAILVANHAGVLPIDSAMLCLDVLRRTEPPRIPRAVADHFVPRLPLVSTLFARLGVVRGTRANVRRLLERGELIAIWPEGVTGPAKRFADRYRIQRWRVGFAELAIRYRAPVVPVAILGAEESWPLLAKLRTTHVFGSPYLPIPASPIPLPTHYHIRYGMPHVLGQDAADAANPDLVASAARKVRDALERLIDDARRERRGVFR